VNPQRKIRIINPHFTRVNIRRSAGPHFTAGPSVGPKCLYTDWKAADRSCTQLDRTRCINNLDPFVRNANALSTSVPNILKYSHYWHFTLYLDEERPAKRTYNNKEDSTRMDAESRGHV